MTTTLQPTVLMLGATGSLGKAITRNLAERGWSLRALHRHPESAAAQLVDVEGIDWRGGDVMNAADTQAAGRGCDLIVHSVNPPGYRNWREEALPMLENVIEAARASGAALVFPANVYNYASDIGYGVTEQSPQHPTTRKGAIRVEMEQKLRAAADSGVRVIVLRAGDFFGPGTGLAWFSVMVRPGQQLRRILYPGALQIDHTWAYLPDLAEAFAQLMLKRADLPPYADFHFAGHTLNGQVLVDTLRQVSGEANAPVRPFAWWPLRLIAPFHATSRELCEMRYLWQRPLTLDNTRLVRFLGAEPHTPLRQALEETLVDFNCLPASFRVQTA
ncbi:hypothetical protein MSNKSG1_06083 [Marinobacter santoriniensis NKSG1]|uniref:NAD-dependent epimerase/dehydratase domain-containing protein n=1 Tax=Marinobacter santoriniensis NKSG1 TaxID=1288826 RepID=M7CP62_9GAMM|nr:NAD-dependent epimerase/dehydratase family protein [Marinobacter santoriniensis]EMP55416.1 hypothetical protein MSNKSG1_06083 [Marinobacter santoriniensis NKSG1]